MSARASGKPPLNSIAIRRSRPAPLTDERDGSSDDALGDLLDLDGADIIHLAGEGAAGDGRAPERHVDAVFSGHARTELGCQAAVAVVFDLRRHRQPGGSWSDGGVIDRQVSPWSL